MLGKTPAPERRMLIQKVKIIDDMLFENPKLNHERGEVS